MPALSPTAVTILDRMEAGLAYDPAELRSFAPELSPDGLGEVMHELWIAREVERFGSMGWRRLDRTNGRAGHVPAQGDADLRVGAVKPEDFFDHESFAGWFK